VAAQYQINVVVPNVSAGNTFDDAVDVTVQVNGVPLPTSGGPLLRFTLPVVQQ
jgi:hypothetical protein